jgi:hypothetical protein
MVDNKRLFREYLAEKLSDEARRELVAQPWPDGQDKERRIPIRITIPDGADDKAISMKWEEGTTVTHAACPIGWALVRMGDFEYLPSDWEDVTFAFERMGIEFPTDWVVNKQIDDAVGEFVREFDGGRMTVAERADWFGVADGG